jgi:membrane-bound lytic murein transglycosylase D
MPIQRRFVLAAAVSLSVLASGTVVSSVTAAPWPEDFDGPSPPVEHAAMPPPADERSRPDLIGEQTLDGVGSVAEQEAASETEPAGIDPWAEAFAESSRAAVLPKPKPSYPVALNAQVQFFLDRFTGTHRDIVNLWVGRAGRYLTMIRDVLKRRGLPEELAYTAMIESGFNPVAVSRVGAKGLWQFMASTARRYGLRVDSWIDERLDPEKSTVAAAAYLRDLHTQFGSWTLAQAAYNAGEVKVTRAMRLTGSSDFWALAQSKHLRRETKEFVPQIHAATLIGEDPGRYGFEFREPEPSMLETVTVPASTDLRRLAVRTGITLQTLRALNPVLVRMVTPPGAPWPLVVPTGAGVKVQAALAPPPKRPATAVAASGRTKRGSGAADTVYVVRPRDTVASIAKRHGLNVTDVLRWNSLEEQSPIHPGDRLRIAEARPSAELDGQGGFR